MSEATTNLPVRPWMPADAAHIDHLLDELWGHDPIARSLFGVHGEQRSEAGGFSRTVVSEVNGAVVGVGTVREYWLHPTRWRVTLHVHDDAQRRGVGATLFERLLLLIPHGDERPIQAATRADDRSGLRFLDHREFHLVMRTRRGTIDSGAIDRAAWDEFARVSLLLETTGYSLGAAGRHGRDLADLDTIANLHAEIYQAAHQWNPSVALTLSDARMLFLGDDLIPEALFVATFERQPFATASLRRTDRPPMVDLEWVGVG